MEEEKQNFQNILKVGQQEINVPQSFYKGNRELLVKNIKEKINPPPKSIVFMVGVPTIPYDDQDIEHWVQQECNFEYLFGVQEPDCYAAIEIDTGRTILFPEHIPEDYKMWMVVKDSQMYKEEYQVDEVIYNDSILQYVQNYKPATVFLYDGVDSDSGLKPRLPDLRNFGDFVIDQKQLYAVLNEQRTVKNETELELMRFITRVSSEAHIQVMQNVKPGLQQHQMEALFSFYHQERCGAKQKSYDHICACGVGNATLHYNVNDKVIGESELILNDMGGRYKGYCSDITCTFPSNGKFTQQQREIYEAVLDANLAVHQAVGEGVSFEEMHKLAELRILSHLQKIGLVVSNVPVQELVDNRVGAVFMPHGLGHFIGTRVHDVGGYNEGQPQRLTEPGLKSLRTRRVLKKNNAITIEPGCYFVDFILQRAYKDEKLSKYLVKEKIDAYAHIGGVRIEDDVIVLEKGCENMTIVPRTVEEIENCMAGKPWKKN